MVEYRAPKVCVESRVRVCDVVSRVAGVGCVVLLSPSVLVRRLAPSVLPYWCEEESLSSVVFACYSIVAAVVSPLMLCGNELTLGFLLFSKFTV